MDIKNNYYAKSNPIQTIQEHTDMLLENLELFKKLYPNYLDNYDLLELACKFHDLGKMNIRFQNKIISSIEKNSYKNDSKEIPHGILSLAFINTKNMKVLGYSRDEIRLLFQAIAYHHDRDLLFENEDIEREIELLKPEVEGFEYPKLGELLELQTKISKTYYVLNSRIYENEEELFLEYIKVKGLLNRLDYAASSGIEVEVENSFLEDSLERFRASNNWEEWNDLQKFMKDNKDYNTIVIAQTGMGKTEAGLLWIGDNKGFFTLPLKTAINEIYKRASEKITNNKECIGLLHSETIYHYVDDKTIDHNELEEYYQKTKQMSLPINICTLDQIFDFVFKYRGFEVKLATLGYSKIVIDEVQMYSPDLLAYLIVGLSYIDKMGGKFAILTATLPSIVKELLSGEGINFVESKTPFINDGLVRHSVKVIEDEINPEYILEKYLDNKVLVICNTVRKAKEIYLKLKSSNKIPKGKLNLLHSRYSRTDRKEKEEHIMSFGKTESNETGIWVATQVVEASLDIDFDVLITELSDVNGFLQRMGRCYRKRQYELANKNYNVYLFNGGEKQCSGVGNVIDKEIFQKSKNATNNLDGPIKESEKLILVENVYSTMSLKKTDYYKELVSTIKYIKSITEFEKGKKDVSFRNIDNITILPKCIYNNNKDTIEGLLKSYLEEENPREKQKKWMLVSNYFLDVPFYEVENKKPEILEISKSKKILIYDGFTYDYEIGLEKCKEIKQENDNII